MKENLDEYVCKMCQIYNVSGLSVAIMDGYWSFEKQNEKGLVTKVLNYDAFEKGNYFARLEKETKY